MMVKNIPVIILGAGYGTPTLPKGFKWGYQTEFHIDKVTLAISVISTRNPLAALVFRRRNKGLTTLTQDFPRGDDIASAMQGAARFMEKKLYNQLFSA